MKLQTISPKVTFQATYRFDNTIRKDDILREHPLYQVVSLTDPEHPLKFKSPHTEFNKPMLLNEVKSEIKKDHKKDQLILPGGKLKEPEIEEHSYFGLIDLSTRPLKSLVLMTPFSPLETTKNYKKCLEIVGQLNKVGLIREETLQRLKGYIHQLFLGIADGGFVRENSTTTYLTHGPIRTGEDPESIYNQHQKKLD